jgi:DNA-binding GntR family transcriptional regulator
VDDEASARGNNEPLSIRLAGEFHIVLAEMTGSALLTRYLSEVTSRSGLILAIYGRPHSSECAVSEHRAIIDALTANDPKVAAEVMDRHLEAVADRALIQTTSQKRRELRDVLDAYVQIANGSAGRPAPARRKR